MTLLISGMVIIYLIVLGTVTYYREEVMQQEVKKVKRKPRSKRF